MSILEKEVKIMCSDGSIKNYHAYFQDSGEASISISFEDGSSRSFDGPDLFSSLELVRAYFEGIGAKVLCNGARVNAYPSRMSRSMGRGRKIYLLRHGKQARRSDLIDIFDYADPEQVGSIEEQKRYYREWIDSLGN